MQAVQLLLRLTKDAKGLGRQQAVVVECSEPACTRMQSYELELFAMPKAVMTEASIRNAKAQPRPDSVQGWQRRRLERQKGPAPEKCSAAANLSCRQSCIAAAVDLAQRRAKI